MTVNTPERAGVGTCERCSVPNVERVRYRNTVTVTDWQEGGQSEKEVVLVEAVCEDCYLRLVESEA